MKRKNIITPRESKALENYLNEIGKNTPLSPDEELALARRVQMGDQQALESLTRANLKFVVSVAKQYMGQGMSLPDLINEGNIGLIRAARRYEGERGIRFVSYAVWWIRQSIVSALNEQTRLLQSIGSPLSVDAPLAHDSRSSLLDVIENEDSPHADSALLREGVGRGLADCIDHLPERDRFVLRQCYGMDGAVLTYAEIGERLGVGRERVRQIRTKALRRLRRIMKQEMLRGN